LSGIGMAVSKGCFSAFIQSSLLIASCRLGTFLDSHLFVSRFNTLMPPRRSRRPVKSSPINSTCGAAAKASQSHQIQTHNTLKATSVFQFFIWSPGDYLCMHHKTKYSVCQLLNVWMYVFKQTYCSVEFALVAQVLEMKEAPLTTQQCCDPNHTGRRASNISSVQHTMMALTTSLLAALRAATA
jgi:hypothetical protein